MSDILATIIAHKRKEVAELKELVPLKKLEKSAHFSAPTVSLKKYIMRPEMHGIIAEIKRRSPSKGVINQHINVESLSIGYMQAGASALSILTDREFFGGKSEDLTIARQFNYCPILRKDFIIDPYQIIEAKSIGADAVLLIGAVLTETEIISLSDLSHSLGLEVLYEIHSESELKKLTALDNIIIIGVNSRNLKDFTIDLSLTEKLAAKIPSSVTKIAESGIQTVEDILRLKALGFNGFLIGELFMKTSDPALACSKFIQKIKSFS